MAGHLLSSGRHWEVSTHWAEFASAPWGHNSTTLLSSPWKERSEEVKGPKVTELGLESRTSSPWYSHIRNLMRKKIQNYMHRGGRTQHLADEQKDSVCEELGEAGIRLAFPGLHHNRLVENRVYSQP